MQKTQFNLNEIRRLTSAWAKYPLFERKDGKKDTVLCLNERGNRVNKRYAEIGGASVAVQRFITNIIYDMPFVYSTQRDIFYFNLFVSTDWYWRTMVYSR